MMWSKPPAAPLSSAYSAEETPPFISEGHTLLRCLKALEDGDTLIVWKLDRLGRSLRDLIDQGPDRQKVAIIFRTADPLR